MAEKQQLAGVYVGNAENHSHFWWFLFHHQLSFDELFRQHKLCPRLHNLDVTTYEQRGKIKIKEKFNFEFNLQKK